MSISGMGAEPTAPTEAPTAPVNEANAPAKTQADKITDALLASIAEPATKANFKMLIYGEPGSTKSSFAGTAPNNLVWDMEDGLVSMRTSPNGMAENVKAIPFKSFWQGEELVKRLADRHEAFDWVDVLTVDTMSDLHKRGLEEIMRREHEKRPSMNMYVPETEHYTELNEKIARFSRSLRNLDRDLIIITHARTVEPKNKPAKTYPDFSESLANKVEAMMDIVGYMSLKNIDGVMTPVLRVQTDGTVHAKTRIPLPAEIANPTYPKIKAAWEKVING